MENILIKVLKKCHLIGAPDSDEPDYAQKARELEEVSKKHAEAVNRLVRSCTLRYEKK